MYAISIFGIGIKQFYCCGKLQSTSISFVQHSTDKCDKGSEKSDCCKTKFQSLKVKDPHITADAINNQVNHFSEVINFTPAFENQSLLLQQTVINNRSHAPPLLQGTPLYILHCLYRI